MSLHTQVVVITGAAGSLGRAVAAAFAEEGAQQILLDLSERGLREAYPEPDPQRLLIAADLTDALSTQRAVDRGFAHYGRIDALCNIAGGFAMGTPVHATPAEEWTRMMNLNALTMLHAVQAAVPKMLAAGGGRIVSVGAGVGQKGGAMMGAYSVSKSAVIRMTESMSAELREQNINVNCVLPSTLDTPANRAAMPDADPGKWVALADLAATIRFLCSADARAIHGAAIPVVGLGG